jgi:hypothetical protein
VLLIAREGGKGFEGRVDAFKAHHSIADDTDRIVFMRSPANLGDAAQFEELKAAVTNCGRAFKVVVADTVGRALPGEDLYDPKSITAFMERLQQLGEIGGGVAIGVHHTNKSGDLFGSVYFGASSDFMFQWERDGYPKREPLRTGKITCTNIKDGEDGWSRAIRYEKVAGSLAVVSIVAGAPAVGSREKLTTNDRLALQALDEAIKSKGRSRAEMPGGRSVTIDEWLDQCFTAGVIATDAAKPRRDLHNRQVNLIGAGRIFVHDNLVQITLGGAPITPRSLTPVVGGVPPIGLPPIPQR